MDNMDKMNCYTFDELAEDFAGQKRKAAAGFIVEVTQGMMEAFAELSGDTNPLHTDEGFALRRGFEGRVAYGMLVASFYSRLVGVYLPGKNCLFQSIDGTFNRPVYAGDVLSVTGRVTQVDERFSRIKIKAEIRRLAATSGSERNAICAAISNQQSAISNQQSAISNQQSAISNQQSSDDTLRVSSVQTELGSPAKQSILSRSGVKVGGAILWCGVLKDESEGGDGNGK